MGPVHVPPRGPITVLAALLTVITPQILNLSLRNALGLGTLFFGLLVTYHDAKQVAVNRVKRTIRQQLDSVVLDNLLKSIFDPENGWIACFFGMAFANACMYTLPMSDNHRIQLLQSSLGLAEGEAQTLLQNPGGIKAMLPEAFLHWIEPNSHNFGKREDETRSLASTVTEDCLEEPENPNQVNYSATQVPPILEGTLLNQRIPVESTERVRDERLPVEAFPVPQPIPSPPQLLLSILREMMEQRLKGLIDDIPSQTLRVVGTVATVGVIWNLRSNPRYRMLLWSMMRGTAAIGLSGVAVASLAALLLKHHWSQNARNANDSSAPSQQQQQQQRNNNRLLSLMDRRKWQCCLAFLVMFLIKKRGGFPNTFLEQGIGALFGQTPSRLPMGRKRHR